MKEYMQDIKRKQKQERGTSHTDVKENMGIVFATVSTLITNFDLHTAQHGSEEPKFSMIQENLHSLSISLNCYLLMQLFQELQGVLS